MTGVPSDTKFIVISLTFSLVIILGAVFFLSRSNNSSINPGLPVDSDLLIRADSYQLGSDSAKIKIVEFADFQCPACRTLQPVLNKIKEQYPDQIAFIFRHFPLPQHTNAITAAQAAEAAGKQAKFFEYIEILYQNQDNWAKESNPKSLFIEYAQSLGLDITRFEADMKDPLVRDKINRDLSDAKLLEVNSTPTLFLNNQRVQNLNYENFQRLIDQNLNN